MYRCISCFSPFTGRLHTTVSSFFGVLHRLFPIRNPFLFLLVQNYRANYPTIRQHTKTWDAEVDGLWNNWRHCQEFEDLQTRTQLQKKKSLFSQGLMSYPLIYRSSQMCSGVLLHLSHLMCIKRMWSLRRFLYTLGSTM